MIKVGLTGGIGSGKSTVANIFASYGIPIYNSDDRAKWLMNNKAELIEAICGIFGKKAYSKGNLDRKHIASLAFEDKSLLTRLNQTVHPAVAADFENWCSVQISNFVIKEAAILIESGGYAQCNKIITVNAPVEVRIERVIERDNCDSHTVLSRMQHQYTDEQRMEYADYIIHNTGQEHLIHQVRMIVDDLKHCS